LVILVDGKVVGSALSLIVDESLVDKNHNSDTGNIPFDPQSKKDVLYGIDIFIHPITVDCLAVDCMMLEKLCEQLNLKAIVLQEGSLITASTLLR
jgi:hypothetical protein